MAADPVTDGTRAPKSEHAFEWAFALGFAVILATKLVAREQPILGGLVASGIGVAIMVIHLARQRRERPEDEHARLGDEIYYLGLLYTLTSLCAALVSLFLLDGNHLSLLDGGERSPGERTLEERINEMVGSFGIALLTTMAGIVMRIPLQRRATDGRATVIRIPHSARDSREGTVEIEGVTVDLARYAYELRRQLQASTNAFKSYASQATQQAETTDAIYMRVAENAEKTRQRMEAQLQASIDALKSYADQAIRQARTTHAHMDEMMQAFHDGLTEKAKAGLEGLDAIYRGVAENAEKTGQRMEAQQAEIRSAMEHLEAHVKSLDESIERIRAGSGETADNLGAIGVQAKESSRALAESGKAATEGLNALAAATDAERTYQESRTRFANEMTETLERQANEWTEVQRRADGALKEMESANQALAGLGEEARRTERELAILPQGLHKAGEAIERLTGIANASSELSNLETQAKLVTDQLEGVVGASKRQEEALGLTVKKLEALAEAADRELEDHGSLKGSIAEIADIVATAGRYGESLKDAESEIRRINTGLKGIRNAMQDEGLKLSEVLKQAIIAFDEAGQRGGSARSWIGRVFRR